LKFLSGIGDGNLEEVLSAGSMHISQLMEAIVLRGARGASGFRMPVYLRRFCQQ
jgi:hypothetical protein